MNANAITNRFSMRRRWLAHGAALLLAATVAGTLPGRANAGVFISVNFAPPALPVYVQPPIPGPGYIWTPGYWAWDGAEYYWVPGTWVLAPYVGALWTPGYWGWSSGVYIFHAGYWGPHVGFYGGINYGFGYGGFGYSGGYWNHGGFYYNRSVNHITNNITNVYNRTVINNTTINRTSFNGGPNGIAARATPEQMAWARGPHTPPVAAQMQQREMASHMPSMRATVNHGVPPLAATPRAGVFNDNHVAPMAAHEMRYTPQGNGALRSAGYAPRNNAAYRPTDENRYQPAAYGNRATAYRPQGYQPQAYRAPSQNYRPAQTTYRPEQRYQPEQRYAQSAYRPATPYRPSYRPVPRPAQYAHPAPRGGGDRSAYAEHRDHH